MGLETDVSKTYAYRRERIMSKLRGSGTTTTAMIQNVAESFSNGEVTIIEYNDEHKFEVKFTGTIGMPLNMDDLTAAIEEIKPAHLAYTYVYIYTTNQTLSAYSHAQLSAYSHYQLRNDGDQLMATTTTNYGLTKPDLVDYYDISISNNNMDIIDAEMKAAQNAADAAQTSANTVQSLLDDHEADCSHHVYYSADSGTTDAYAVTINGITAYSQLIGVPVYVKCPTANATAATLNINSLGAVNIVRGTGTALLTGDITAGKIVQLIYDGAYFQLLSQGVDTSQASKLETLSNKTMTAPKIVSNGYISDENGNEQIKFITTSSAVNEITITNAAIGSAPSISVTGGDTNVSLNLISKGTGTVQANGKAVATKSNSVSVTLAAASWSGTTVPYTYTATVSGVTSTSNQDLSPTTSIPQAQLLALQAANIIGYSPNH